MRLSKIRFKGEAFEHNPETLRVTDKANVKEDNLLFDEPQIRRTGRKCRVISGKGQFAGENCIFKYTQLLRLYYKGGSGILSLPDIKPFFAYFTRLELSCDPTPELVEYYFEFVEDFSSGIKTVEPYFHTGTGGENLWDVSYAYGVDINTLVKLNPEIRFINESLNGIKVRIC
ncbi:MAG: hypothetical protein IIU14_05165 [Ruminococcus sp.]|nr:hypothetical protein [Ruminococcus sp.]